MKNKQQESVNKDGISRQELRTVLKAMDKEGFNKLMEDYMHEISDPNNVKESNDYLQQMASTNDLPANVKLAKPSEGFCVKSSKYHLKKKQIKTKCFVNITSYDGIKKPEVDEKGYWSVPYLLNKGRNDKDSKNQLCMTYDVVFHPEAISMSNRYPQFKKFVCDSAIDGLNGNLLSKTEEQISKYYSYVDKFKYKGNEIALMNVHSLNKSEFSEKLEGKDNYVSKMQKEIEAVKEEEAETEFDKPDVEINEDLMKPDTSTPIYKVKFSQNFELHKYFYSPEELREAEGSEICVIELNVPRLLDLNKAELKLEESSLFFRYLDVYEINVELKSKLIKDKGKAEFIKEKKMLKITCPVKKSEKKVEKQEELEIEKFVDNRRDGKKEDKRSEVEVQEMMEKEKVVEKVKEKELTPYEQLTLKKKLEKKEQEQVMVPAKIEEEPKKMEEVVAVVSKETVEESEVNTIKPDEDDADEDIRKPVITEVQKIEKEKTVLNFEFFDFDCELIADIDY